MFILWWYLKFVRFIAFVVTPVFCCYSCSVPSKFIPYYSFFFRRLNVFELLPQWTPIWWYVLKLNPFKAWIQVAFSNFDVRLEILSTSMTSTCICWYIDLLIPSKETLLSCTLDPFSAVFLSSLPINSTRNFSLVYDNCGSLVLYLG